ncbi:MAG: polysaccharide deacetylase family protein [Bacteroidota bacterium]
MATYEKDGQQRPLIVKNSSGVDVLFDLEKTYTKICTERYDGATLNHGIFAKLPFDYNKFPTWFIGLMSKMLAKRVKISELPPFPNYPLDCSVDLLRSISDKSGGTEGSIWPDGKKYAVCFTHDVDTDWVFRNDAWLDKFREAEENNGIASAWYIVPKEVKSAKAKKLIGSLVASGHEIGAHGYTHDPGLPQLPEKKLREYMKKSHGIIRALSDEEIGYRAPWLAREASMFEILQETGFAYDSSVPNADFVGNNEHSNNGCCTVFPYLRNKLPILPLTIPLDTIATPLNKSPIEFYDWVIDITEKIKKVGGVVVITTHTTPHFSANDPMIKAYHYFIEKITADKEAWITLPRNIVNRYMNSGRLV